MAKKKQPQPPPPTQPPPPLTPSTTKVFEQDVKRCRQRGKKLAKLWDIVATLCARRPLEASRRDHKLHGDWRGCRECHIEGDWLLIYRVSGNALELIRTGTHADLFE